MCTLSGLRVPEAAFIQKPMNNSPYFPPQTEIIIISMEDSFAQSDVRNNTVEKIGYDDSLFDDPE